tara:strand:+ start:3419 stop:3565 length:147 start_codon:yes stop_codon:yes gene_type:complete
MTDQFIQGLTLAVDKKFITMSQAFEIIKETNSIDNTTVDKSIGFKQNR